MPATTKERPILFSAEMVRAILDGRKTQTRRVAKAINECFGREFPASALDRFRMDGATAVFEVQSAVDDTTDLDFACPYGQPGDVLWVRERHLLCKLVSHPATPEDCTYICYPDGGQLQRESQSLSPPSRKFPRADQWPSWTKWRPSIHMPHWASRLSLEVVSIRVELVREISEEDAVAEGVSTQDDHPAYCPECNGLGVVGTSCDYSWDCVTCSTAAGRFSALWDSINAKRGFGWDVNPWVWVVEFRRQGRTSLPS